MKTAIKISSPSNFHLSLEECIKRIKNAPILILEHHHGIILDFKCRGNHGEILKGIREKYIGIATWLEFYLLQKNELNLELLLTTKKHMKPYAEMAIAYFQLARETFVIACDPNIKDYQLEPHTWMMWCVFDLCENDLECSGLLAIPEKLGVSTQWKMQQAHLNWLETTALTGSGINISQPITEIPACESPIDALELFAQSIARENIQFRNGFYRDYVRIQKRCIRQLYNSKYLKTMYLDDETGQPKVLVRGKDTRVSKRSNGFKK